MQFNVMTPDIHFSILTVLYMDSRVAQWKRAGPITQRSEDQNLALLITDPFIFIFALV